MRNVRTGKGASLLINNITVPITSLKSNLNTEYAKATDSANYVAATDTLYTAQVPGETNLKVSVEGHFDLSQTSAAIFSLIQTGAVVSATVYDFPSSVFASGNFNVGNGSTTLTVPGSTMYTFSCDLISNGPYTLGGG